MSRTARFASLGLMIGCSSCTDAAPTGPVGQRTSLIQVAEDMGCRVVLTKISYDDPGADDDEFIELRVDDGLGPGTTLADCGLDALVHLNGAAGYSCGNEITRLSLEATVVPEDQYVTICTRPECDVEPAGDGWLQNGPDALRFVDTAGRTTAQIIWRGDPNRCFALSPAIPSHELVREMPAPSSDDVNVWCDDGFVLVDSTHAPRRAEHRCPDADAGSAPDGGLEAGVDAPVDDGGPPAGDERPGATFHGIGGAPTNAADAATDAAPRVTSGWPPRRSASSSGCQTSRGSIPASPAWLLGGLVLGFARYRRRRPTTNSSETAPRRSGSLLIGRVTSTS